ncbi:MAG TPA: VanZ family protein [Longimicrobiaceae bacterium]|nr:VanZ family protein [Longimicrobiaceae bacterium]
MSRTLRPWAPAVLWAAALFAVSARATLPIDLHSGSDKLAHFGAYLILGLALGFARVRTGASFYIVLALGVLYGASDEFHQSFVPGRSADVADWIADSLGVLSGLLLHHAWSRARRRSRAAERMIAGDPIPND